MAINPLEAAKGVLTGGMTAPIAPLTANPKAISGPATDGKGDTGFVGMLEKALGDLNDLAQNADTTATRAAQGEDVDLHDLVLSMENAGMGFQLALQVRNKLVEAYTEISRMQV